VFELDPGLDLPRALSRLRGRRGLCALDSAAGEPGRHGLVGFDPVLELRLPAGGDAFELLHAAMDGFELAPGDELPGPFHGGFLGALSYDLGARGERPVEVAPEPWGLPLFAGGLYTDFLVRDELCGRTWLVLGDDVPADPGEGRAPLAERRAALERDLCGPDPAAAVSAGRLLRHVPPDEHRRRIERARAYIAAGDIYQVNLAHRFTAPTRGAPVDLFAALRRVNPAPYMAYLDLPGGALLSASPELLLEHDGELLRTRPIKGTLPRGATEEEDRELARRLLASEKDRAELAMIVDLERNDLGRVAAPGGVWVEGFPTLRSYARVHHLLADVVARPAAGLEPRAALAALAALHPGGSVTGAPKLRSMEILAELEGEGRGFFCGSLGFLDARGHCAFNLLIRTMLWRPRTPRARPGGRVGPLPDGEVSFRVGGGITFSSDAAAEDRETLAKAAGLIAALDPEGAGAEYRIDTLSGSLLAGTRPRSNPETNETSS